MVKAWILTAEDNESDYLYTQAVFTDTEERTGEHAAKEMADEIRARFPATVVYTIAFELNPEPLEPADGRRWYGVEFDLDGGAEASILHLSDWGDEAVYDVRMLRIARTGEDGVGLPWRADVVVFATSAEEAVVAARTRLEARGEETS
jgi:hypothetical protein